jgi:hypothetical protein
MTPAVPFVLNYITEYIFMSFHIYYICILVLILVIFSRYTQAYSTMLITIESECAVWNYGYRFKGLIFSFVIENIFNSSQANFKDEYLEYCFVRDICMNDLNDRSRNEDGEKHRHINYHKEYGY